MSDENSLGDPTPLVYERLRFHDDTERYTMPNDEKLTPERAVRLLRAKAGELEHWFAAHADDPKVPVAVLTLAPDIALIAQLLADHIERTEDRLIDGVMAATAAARPIVGNFGLTEGACGPECSEGHTYRSPCALAPVASVENNEHIISLYDGGWLIQHPLQERLNGSLFNCKVKWTEDDLGVYGRFVLVWDEEADEWVLGAKVQ